LGAVDDNDEIVYATGSCKTGVQEEETLKASSDKTNKISERCHGGIHKVVLESGLLFYWSKTHYY
jgi:hypothetical protein